MSGGTNESARAARPSRGRAQGSAQDPAQTRAQGHARTRDRRPRYARLGTAAVIGAYAVLVIGAAITLLPFLLSLLTSLKSAQQFASEPVLALPNPITIENYTELLTSSQAHFAQSALLTATVAVVVAAVQITGSVLAAFAFAKLRFPGRDALFWVFLATMMVPGVVILIPLYVMFVQLDLTNSFLGLVLPTLLGSPYAIFLLRQSFLRVPDDLIGAARLDGAGSLRILTRIMIPLNWPIISTLVVITIVTHWNAFIWPLIIASKPRWQVLTVATANLQSQYDGNWTLVMAATALSMLPLLVLFAVFQRRIVSSLAITGGK